MISTQRIVNIEDLGTVKLQKRRGQRSIRLRLNREGTIYVSLPMYASYSVAIDFARSKQQWIKKARLSLPRHLLEDNQPIGKYRTLKFSFSPGSTIHTKLLPDYASVYLPINFGWDSIEAQAAARRIHHKALKADAEQLLPARVARIAADHNFNYHSLRFRAMRSRWGSCASGGNITLNSYLMELSEELIDYVIIHELAHTKIMAHSAKFWSCVEECLPKYKYLRKQLRTKHPF